MSRFNCNDCCLNNTSACRYGANKSIDYSEQCPDLLVEQNEAYDKALADLLQKLEEIDECEFAMFSLALIKEKAEELQLQNRKDQIIKKNEEGAGESEQIIIKEITMAEYESELKEEIERGCILKAIHKRCDEINYICSDLGYLSHREVQEQMVEIQDLIKAYMDMQKGSE